MFNLPSDRAQYKAGSGLDSPRLHDHDIPAALDLVLAGGGHAHVAVLRRLGMRPVPGLRVTLVCPDLLTPYSGMLPGLVAGHYRHDEAHIDLRRLARFAGAQLVATAVTGLDAQSQRVALANRPAMRYDYLSLDIGATSVPLAVGANAGVEIIPVKPVDKLLAGLAHFDAAWRDRPRAARIAVVGGGAGGVELALALAQRYRDWQRPPRLCLYSRSRALLADQALSARRRLDSELAARAITVYTDVGVRGIENSALRLDDGRVHAADAVIGATGAAAPAWLRDSGLAVDDSGFVQVGDSLRSRSHARVFAAGDIAALANARPKSGVYAVRAGPVLAANLVRATKQRRLKRFRAQRHTLALIGTGDRRAIASWARFSAAGGGLWRLKQAIDRRFMARYNELPAMVDHAVAAGTPASPPAATMRCGGCGAKVGPQILDRVLRRLDTRAGRAHDDAAVIDLPAAAVLQSIDYLSDFVGDAYTLGEIAAQHALNDLYASGATPHSALAMASVPVAAETIMEEQLYQLLAGAKYALDSAGARLVGGHSAEGASLGLGFAVNGVRDGAGFASASAAPGMALVLTRALGSGVLFAADMRHAARAPWIAAALAGMRQSNAAAAACLRAHGATACTDVTGFGLIGHLCNMLEPAGLGATLALDALPLLDGARELAAAGYESSLAPHNLRLRRAVAADASVQAHPNWALLFDPQTAGGLLAAVPAERAGACVKSLRARGYHQAARIGRVESRANCARIAVRALVQADLSPVPTHLYWSSSAPFV